MESSSIQLSHKKDFFFKGPI